MLELVGRRDASADAPRHVAPDVAYLRDRIVNVCFVGAPGAADREWALVDAGLPGSADRITHAAARLFGAASRPAAILLTHGHADHVGAVRTLMRRWDAPVYAHEMELPYLTGRSSYPPADPFVGGGAMSVLSVLFPRAPIHLGSHVHALPADGSVPGMRGWRWIPTPGHSPGHVSFVRDVDRTLIAGDAFVTTKNESLIAALTQRAELHGPPMYLTPDWDAARVSLRHLAAYSPSAAITGHGPPMRGEPLQSALRQLASQFDARARPAHGRYRDRPAIMSASGVVDVPPAQMGPGAMVVTGLAIGAAIGVGVVLGRRGGARAAAFAPSAADDVSLAQGAELAAADGGYDVTTATVPTLPVAVPPTSIELR
ncbi:MAG TPA: MBL fold metallo-hydrolase [Gemmatimonadaceae bacterium]|nr:MBL fold metallo-hydrolase [Gemmatimonadaceae bacterium]